MDYCYLLGMSQDAGVPQVGCDCANCASARKAAGPRRRVAALGIVLEDEGKVFLIDATPDFVSQADELRARVNRAEALNPVDGIFITHLHVGHYVGLLFLGRESCSARRLPVYTSRANCDFLKANRPFSHLVGREEIELREFESEPVRLGGEVSIESFPVRHRNEDGDTCGCLISGRKNTIAYLPDLDEWDQASQAAVRSATVAILDGSFSTSDEIPPRADRSIGHPTIETTRKVFEDSDTRLIFTHFNHTNILAGETPGEPEILEL